MEESLPLPHELLAQRYPFLLIDRIIGYQLGLLRAVKCVTYNEPYFQGHFPGLAIVPGVLLIEMMVQASAALYRFNRGLADEKIAPVPGRIAAIEKARFLKEVHPGDQLLIETRLQQRIGMLARFEAHIAIDNNLIAESILVLVSTESRLPSSHIHSHNHNE